MQPTPEVAHVFTIRNEDWLLIIGEALPAAHTWFRSREDYNYECSWIPRYLAYKESRSLCPSKQVLQEAELAFSSLGVVNCRPAARLDLWGLVVMAYANGAWSEVELASDGGFMVNLQAKNFVLNINQTNINAPVAAQLEPRQHPAEGRESLGVDDTKYLFLYGQSVSQQDVSLGWPLNADPSTQPPLDLVHGRMDKQLRKTVLDYFRVHDLRKRIRDAIFYYRTKWSKFIRKLEHPDRVYDEPTVKNIQFELDQLLK